MMKAETIEYLYPVQSVTVHRGGHLTVNRGVRFCPKSVPDRTGTYIDKLSTKSLRRLNHIMQTTKVSFGSMLTLTYPEFYPRDKEELKDGLYYIIRHIKKYSPSYLWFLEFQKRGAPHFHILTTVTAITPHMRYDIAEKWVSHIVKQEYYYAFRRIGEFHKDVGNMYSVAIHWDTWQLLKSEDGAKRYVSKYATKTYQKQIPERYQGVGRFWGCSKDVSDIEGVDVELTLPELMQFLDDHNHPAAEYDYLPKYLWGVAGSGEKVDKS